MGDPFRMRPVEHRFHAVQFYSDSRSGTFLDSCAQCLEHSKNIGPGDVRACRLFEYLLERPSLFRIHVIAVRCSINARRY